MNSQALNAVLESMEERCEWCGSKHVSFEALTGDTLCTCCQGLATWLVESLDDEALFCGPNSPSVSACRVLAEAFRSLNKATGYLSKELKALLDEECDGGFGEFDPHMPRIAQIHAEYMDSTWDIVHVDWQTKTVTWGRVY